MAKLITANNAVTVLDGTLSLSATTLVLTDISNFPILVDVDDYCILTLIRASDGAIEYVKCTSQNVPNRSYEILRGQEGTLALDFLNGDEVRNLLTADQIETLRTVSDDKLPLAGGTLSGDLDLGGNTLDNVATAVNPDEGVNLQQVQDLISAIPTPVNEIIAWARITAGSTTPVISDGSGFSGVTRTSNGRYTFTLSTPLASAPSNLAISYLLLNSAVGSSILSFDRDNSTVDDILVALVNGGGSVSSRDEFIITVRNLGT